MQQSRVYVGMILILIFGEVLGLYGYVFSGEIMLMRQPVVLKKAVLLEPHEANMNSLTSLIVGLILNSKS